MTRTERIATHPAVRKATEQEHEKVRQARDVLKSVARPTPAVCFAIDKLDEVLR